MSLGAVLSEILSLIAFLGSLLPVGLYLVGTPGIIAFTRAANLRYLVAEFMMLSESKNALVKECKLPCQSWIL